MPHENLLTPSRTPNSGTHANIIQPVHFFNTEKSMQEEFTPEQAPFFQKKAAAGVNYSDGKAPEQRKAVSQDSADAGNPRLPAQLKSGIENLSGLDMSDVTVHYNSGKPAQLNALAYTQGNDIYVGPGQEEHLAHEAWHVVQQKQGRVQANLQFKGAAVNNDPALEREADVMGARAQGYTGPRAENLASPAVPASVVKQCRMGLEFETGVHVRDSFGSGLDYKTVIFRGEGAKWHVHADNNRLEFVTDPSSSKDELLEAIRDMEKFMNAVNATLKDPENKNNKDIVFSEKERVPRAGGRDKVKKSTVKYKGAKVEDVINRMGVKAAEFYPSSYIGQDGADSVHFAAKPQATFGIPLEQLLQFIYGAGQNTSRVDWGRPKGSTRQGGALSKTYGEGHPSPIMPFQKGHTGYDNLLPEYIWKYGRLTVEPGKIFELRQALKNDKANAFIPPEDIESVIGLYAAVFHHLNDLGAASANRASFDYIKSAFTFLHRSDFHAMYLAIPDNVKRFFNIPTIQQYTALQDKHLDTALIPPDLAEFTPVPTLRQWLSSIIDPSTLPQPHLKAQPNDSQTGIVPSRLNKESGEQQRKDLLSRGEAVSNSTSMGALPPDKADIALPGTTLHLFEVRNLAGGGIKSQVPYEKWSVLAAELFDFYKEWVLDPQTRLEAKREREVRKDETETLSWSYF